MSYWNTDDGIFVEEGCRGQQ